MSNGKWGDNFEQMDVWRTQTEYNYNQWKDVHSQITLTSVQWDGNYEHIVDWKNENQIKNYINSLDKAVIETKWNFKSLEVFKPGLNMHQGTLRIPLPYEDAINYNYVYTEFGHQPVPPESNTRRESYYYFITSINKVSANTTELHLELDTWTTYCLDVDIDLQLIRGHYPAVELPPSTYLNNPIEAPISLDLIEPELPTLKPVVSKETLISFSKNEPRVLITTSANLRNPEQAFQPNKTGTPPNNWWNSNSTKGWDGSSPVIPVGSQYTNNAGPNLRTYSISPSDFGNFINDLRKKAPQIIETIAAVYVLDESLINETETFSLYGYNLKQVSTNSQPVKIDDINITTSSFNYTTEGKKWSKLFTQQFAHLEIIDNATGEATPVLIETLSDDISVYSRANAMFPFLKLQAFINGIGGNTIKSWNVKPFNNTISAKTFQSDWAETLFELEIPTYAIGIDPRELTGSHLAAANFYQADNRQKAYDIEINSINTLYDNTLDESTTNKTISDRNANTSFNIDERSADNTKSNTTDDIDRHYDIEGNAMLESKNLYDRTAAFSYNQAKIAINWNIRALSEGWNVNFNSLRGSVLGSAATLSFNGTLSNVFRLREMEKEMSIAGASAYVSHTFDGLSNGWSPNSGPISLDDTTTDMGSYSTPEAELGPAEFDGAIADPHTWNIYRPYSWLIARRDLDITEYNRVKNKQTNQWIRDDIYNTAISNISEEKTTNLSNNLGIYNLVRANALRSKNTDTNNAGIRRSMQLNDWNSIYQSNWMKPVNMEGQFSGDSSADAWGLRGLSWRIKHCSKAVEKQAIQVFKRYGYTIPPYWVSNPVLSRMSKFTFWQASDAWVKGNRLNETNKQIISEIFENGTTVWRNPAEVRNVDISSNSI